MLKLTVQPVRPVKFKPDIKLCKPSKGISTLLVSDMAISIFGFFTGGGPSGMMLLMASFSGSEGTLLPLRASMLALVRCVALLLLMYSFMAR